MEPLRSPLRLGEEAALALHEPDLSAGQVTDLLVALVRDLGLAKAVYEPAGGGTTPPEEGFVPAPVHRGSASSGRPDLAGILWYRPCGPEVGRHVESLAAHASLALGAVADRQEMVRREDSVRRIAEKLQDSLLPPLPELEQTLLAVEYRAAGRDTRVGGDFYDVFPMPDGRVLIVVGDVMGKGVEAASRTSRITQTLRALAMQGLGLDELLARVDEQVSFQDPDIMATVWCGLYVPATGELVFASLGHPPALLMRESASDPVHLALQGLPLGLRGLSEEPPECRDRRLAPRDLLVLYTDGVIESSGDVIAGLEALHTAVRARRDEPLHLLVRDSLDELLAQGGHTDDAVMLLLRRR
ncbi:MAG TPA: PP2C family protein-serine/threonine phosphatase [Egibacteraceae bacterium]|nr:PP2C family protein-serine/threonine phosphatase [Egibacteraceae bacterium]